MRYTASVDVRGRRKIIGQVWTDFIRKYGISRMSYETDSPRMHVFAFENDNLAMNFARTCQQNGLRAAVYPLSKD